MINEIRKFELRDKQDEFKGKRVLTKDQAKIFKSIISTYETTRTAVVTGQAGCVDCDTEFLTPKGWKRIGDYEHGDTLCQWNTDGSTQFVYPDDYIKVGADTLNRVNFGNIEMVLSNEHRVPYITSKGNHAVKRFDEIMELKSFNIPRYFNVPDNTIGTGISDNLIRVLIMQSADGWFHDGKFVINVKKQRKKDRLVQILDEANIEYKILSGEKGYLKLRYTPPKEIAFKGLSLLWKIHKHQAIIAFHELIFWDGSVTKRKNVMTPSVTGNKTDMDIAQYILSVCGDGYTSIFKDKREYRKDDIYDVKKTTRNISSYEQGRAKIDSVKTLDGFKYCFTTGSSFWLARKNGNIFPTGNSGKSVVLMAIKKYCDANGISCAVTASTGKASSNVGGVTIHSYLGLSMVENINAEKVEDALILTQRDDADIEMPDILIVEEFSMVGEKLYNQIQLGKFPFVLYFGDATQARPVKDKMVDWRYIADNYYELTENLRAKDQHLSKLASDFRLQKEGKLSGLDIFDYVNGDSIVEIDYADIEKLPPNIDCCFIGYRNKLVEKFSNILTADNNTMYNLNIGVIVTALECDADFTQNESGYYNREFMQKPTFFNGEDVEIIKLDDTTNTLTSKGFAKYGKWHLKLTKKGIMITDSMAKKESWEAESKAPKYYIHFPKDEVLEYCTLSAINKDTFALVWDGTEDEFSGMVEHYFNELYPYLRKMQEIKKYYKGGNADLSILDYDVVQEIKHMNKNQFMDYYDSHKDTSFRKSGWSNLLNAKKVVSARPTSSRTILKSQGMSISSVILCQDSFYGAADDAKYVGVSRARQGIILVKNVPRDWN